MYLNEKAWEIHQDNKYLISEALKRFLRIYAAMAKDFGITGIYVPEDEELYLRTAVYSIGEWLAKADIEYRRLFLTFWQKRISYHAEDEYEAVCEDERLKGGTEAFLNNSCLISLCLNEKWKRETIHAELFSISDDHVDNVVINNVFCKEQLYKDPILSLLKNAGTVKIYSYTDLWEQRCELFPHLKFCPSVRADLDKLERFYLAQVLKKLLELENYCKTDNGGEFRPDILTKTTPESESTLRQFKKQHTFVDENGNEYLASWHMRFTGIPGRIFFIPEYIRDSMLVCYIGKKLPNATYPT